MNSFYRLYVEENGHKQKLPRTKVTIFVMVDVFYLSVGFMEY